MKYESDDREGSPRRQERQKQQEDEDEYVSRKEAERDVESCVQEWSSHSSTLIIRVTKFNANEFPELLVSNHDGSSD